MYKENSSFHKPDKSLLIWKASDKYLKNDWRTYKNAYINNDNYFRQEENKEWWK